MDLRVMDRVSADHQFPTNFTGLPAGQHSAIAQSYQLAIEKLNQECKCPFYLQKFSEVQVLSMPFEM